MFQELHDEHDQHPDILDRAAISRPQAKSWNWRLTVLIILLFILAVWLLSNAYGQLTSTAVRYTVQIWMTWVWVGVGTTALASAFLLRRRSRLGWVGATVLLSFMAALFTVFLGKLLFNMYHRIMSLWELSADILLEMSLLPLGWFMLYLISQKTVRQIFGVPLKWFWICLAVGVVLGTVSMGWLVF
ncbi:hypothetical protein [Neolewinella persica]|uniref:hypothetical protein n=1 Tax=Neolewinella persica TaxID=70998 RepID=UPI0003627567|nr:hypothetical protein [Neolewinella persica]